MKQRRDYTRTKGRLMVRFGLSGPERTAFTMNLSLTGAFIRTNSVFKPGTTIQTEFEFPDQQKFTLWAQVVWAKRVPPELAHTLACGMGVRFVNPGDDWQEFFKDWQAKKGL